MYKAIQTIFIFLLSIISSLSITAFAQKNYEVGYIITNPGDTIRGYIDNKDWRKNPKNIRFKKTIEDKSPTLYNPLQVSSFYISSTKERYVGAIVDIDPLPTKTDNLIEVESDAEFFSRAITVKDTIFLRTLVKGRVNLYAYEDSKIHFFIQTDTGKIEELIYQKYLLIKIGMSRTYEPYKKQLKAYMKDCPLIEKRIERSLYLENDITKIFTKYNSCVAPELVHVNKREKIKWTPGIVAGVSITNLEFRGVSALYLTDVQFSSSAKPFLGASLSIYLPRNLRAWSIYNEVMVKSYKVEGIHNEISFGGSNYIWNVTFDFSYVKLTNLARYTYPKGLVRPFASIGITNAWAIKTDNKSVESTHTKSEVPALIVLRKHEQGFIGGVGVDVKKWNLEVRYESSNGMSDYSSINSRSKTVYFLVGFRFN